MTEHNELTANQVQEYADAFRNFAFSSPFDLGGDNDERVTVGEVYLIQVGNHNGRFLLTPEGAYLAVYPRHEDAISAAGLVGGKVIALSFAAQSTGVVRATTGLPLDRLGQEFLFSITGLIAGANRNQRNPSAAGQLDDQSDTPF